MSDQLIAQMPDNTQRSQQTNIHAPGGIRTHNLSRRAAAHLRLRLRGHWGWTLVDYNSLLIRDLLDLLLNPVHFDSEEIALIRVLIVKYFSGSL
jgi:hypothetical protein